MTAMWRPASVRALKGVVTGIGAVSRMTGRGGGAVIGGKVALALDKGALPKLAAGRSLYLVSGTNGKTTTTALLAAALGTAGPVVTNMTGANLKAGIVSALAHDLESPVAVLEVDEAALVQVLADTTADVVVLLNLSRDQLDRYGEVRLAAQKWRTSLGARPELPVVATCADPLAAWSAAAGVVVAVNARGPAGYDTSWLWDVDFERLEGRPVIAAGERALGVAVRLRYAGVPHQVCPDPLVAARQLPPGKVELVANYTAFQTVLGAVRG